MVLLVLLRPIPFNIFLPFSDFHRAPGNDHFFSANSNECQITKHTDEVFMIAYRHPDRQTVYSINTDCSTTKFMKLGVPKLLSQTHLLCYCVSCDEFCQVQYIIVIESVTVLSSTCCFSVPGYLYNHAHGVCFLLLLYCTFTSTLPSKFKLCVLANGVSTICFPHTFIVLLLYIYMYQTFHSQDTQSSNCM